MPTTSTRTGGINGRKIIVDSSDDKYAGAPNKHETQEDVGRDFAMVGGFSLFDNFGGTVLQANPQVPNVTVSLTLATAALPNSFSPAPDAQRVAARARWPTSRRSSPPTVNHAGALVADEPSATVKWTAEKAAMEHVGYNVVYDPTFDITTTNFNQYVVNMKNAGVKILFIEQMPENYAAAVIQALNQQDFHPVIVLGGSTYSEELVPNSGGAAAIDGAYMEQNTSLFLGEDAHGDPRRQHLPHLGAEGLARVPRRPVHPVRLAVGGAVQPGAEGGGRPPEPGLGAQGAAAHHLVLRRATSSAPPTPPARSRPTATSSPGS